MSPVPGVPFPRAAWLPRHRASLCLGEFVYVCVCVCVCVCQPPQFCERAYLRAGLGVMGFCVFWAWWLCV